MWKYALASVVGTSHLQLSLPCQDRSVCRILQAKNSDPILVAVVSDGAGSASRSEIGAELACSLLVGEIEALLDSDGSVSDFTRQFAENWLIYFQSAIKVRSETEGLTARDFACTVLAAVVGTDSAAFLQIGDGAIVVSSSEEPGEYCWIFWPQKGEYENTTFFATDQSAIDHLEFAFTNNPTEEIAIFSDGLQRLVLNFDTQQAHSPFFGPMFAPIRSALEGCSETLSTALTKYLNSDKVNNRTDDDKTLILATRRLTADQLTTVENPDGRKDDANPI